MNLKDIVCDIKYAQRLKKLGVAHNSIYVYNLIHDGITDWVIGQKPYGTFESVSTFTVAELGVMLPDSINKCYLCCEKFDDIYHVEWLSHKAFWDKKEANARAKLLIWCIKNGYVKVEDLNNG